MPTNILIIPMLQLVNAHNDPFCHLKKIEHGIPNVNLLAQERNDTSTLNEHNIHLSSNLGSPKWTTCAVEKFLIWE